MTHLGPFAWHVPRHTCVSLHTPATRQRVLAYLLHTCAGLNLCTALPCTLTYLWDMYLSIAKDGEMIGEGLQPHNSVPQSLLSSDQGARAAGT